MKINVGIKDNLKYLFVTDEDNNNIGELEISDSYFQHSLLELGENKYDTDDISDGYHTFGELYHHRAVLFALICNTYKEFAWKSWLHHDGTMFKDFFIVGLNTPQGQYSYHYHKDNWDMFKVQELEYAPEWDGHQPKDVERLLSLYENIEL